MECFFMKTETFSAIGFTTKIAPKFFWINDSSSIRSYGEKTTEPESLTTQSVFFKGLPVWASAGNEASVKRNIRDDRMFFINIFVEFRLIIANISFPMYNRKMGTVKLSSSFPDLFISDAEYALGWGR